MTGQSPLLSRLAIGSLRLDIPDKESQWYLVEGGFAQVQSGALTVLTAQATPADKLDLQEAEAELAEAKTRLSQGDADRARIERDQNRALAKKTLARAQGKS
jgi:F0F1-type ATP synthase epsilon subunit